MCTWFWKFWYYELQEDQRCCSSLLQCSQSTTKVLDHDQEFQRSQQTHEWISNQIINSDRQSLWIFDSSTDLWHDNKWNDKQVWSNDSIFADNNEKDWFFNAEHNSIYLNI